MPTEPQRGAVRTGRGRKARLPLADALRIYVLRRGRDGARVRNAECPSSFIERARAAEFVLKEAAQRVENTSSGASHEDFGVDDVKVISGEQAVKAAIEQNIALFEDPKTLIEALNDGEEPPVSIPKLDDLEAEYLPLRKRRTELMLNRPRRPCLPFNTITPELLKFRLQLDSEQPVDTATDVILRFVLYPPKRLARNGSNYLERHQEVLALASQSLSSVLDKLSCPCSELLSADQLPSANIIIGDTVYDDMRRSGSQRLSEGIVHWSRQPGRSGILPPLRAADMDTTLLANIPIRVGEVYEYCHLGACYHAVFVSDMRCISRHDSLNALAYPIEVVRERITRRRCGVCDESLATIAAYEDRLAPESPFMYCKACFELLHYDKNGNLLYDDFRTFAYHQQGP